MELSINTVKNKAHDIEIVLIDKGKVVLKKKVKAFRQQAEKILPTVEKILKEQDINLHQIKSIRVVNFGGSFTALRLGIVIANSLGYALEVPVAGTKSDSKRVLGEGNKDRGFSIVKPVYDKEPNITLRKSK